MKGINTMKQKKLSEAVKKMENYENVIVIDNDFSDDMAADYFHKELFDYASQMSDENGSDWKEFKTFVTKGDITWTDSGHDYRIYFQGSTDIEVVRKLSRSIYGGSMNLDASEWPRENQERMMVDAAWKIYNGDEFAVERIESFMNYLSRHLPGTLFGSITAGELVEYVRGIDNFDEKHIRLWMKLK
jgi:hypothetical protein